MVFLIGLTSDQEQVSSCCFFFILMNYRGGKRWISRAHVALGGRSKAVIWVWGSACLRRCLHTVCIPKQLQCSARCSLVLSA